MSSNAINAGTLAFTVTAEGQAQVEKQVAALGKKLNDALNQGARTGANSLGTAFTSVAKGVGDASGRVDRLKEQFRDLGVQFRANRLSVQEYTSRLQQLEQGLTRTSNRSDLTSKDMRTLASTTLQVQRAQKDLIQTDAQLIEKVKLVSNEIRALRNNWQKTGEDTNVVKARLKALGDETTRLQTELKATDGGMVKFNQEIARLATAGRSAEATIAGIEGRMSRLGLASQVALGTQGLVQQSLYRYGPAGLIAANSLQGVGAALLAQGPAAVAAAGGFVAVAGAAAYLTQRGIPQVKEFESALRVLVATGENFTAATLDEALRKAAEAAGAAGEQFTRAQIATSLAEIVKAGVSASDALKLLVPGLKLANVTGASLTESTSGLLGNLRQFGLTADDAGRAADQLAKADLAAAHGVAELSDGLATVGPVAHTAGLSFSDTLGILVELDNKGLDPADKGATGLRSALTALLDPTAKARDIIDSLGVKLVDTNGAARPILDVMLELRKALEGDAEAANKAAGIFDTRALPAFLDMSGASAALARDIADSNDALTDYSNTLSDQNLAKSQQALQTALDDLSADVHVALRGQHRRRRRGPAELHRARRRHHQSAERLREGRWAHPVAQPVRVARRCGPGVAGGVEAGAGREAYPARGGARRVRRHRRREAGVDDQQRRDRRNAEGRGEHGRADRYRGAPQGTGSMPPRTRRRGLTPPMQSTRSAPAATRRPRHGKP